MKGTEAATGGVLQNLTKFTGKHLCQSLFLCKPLPATLLEKRLWNRCFPVNFVKCSRTPLMAASKVNINKNGSSPKGIMCIYNLASNIIWSKQHV